jgi:hypothetical protein
VSWVAEHHHHRARSFIGPPSSLLDQAWHVSVISRTPRCVPSHLPKHSSHHHTSSPPQHKETSPVCCSLLARPALSCTTTVRLTTRPARSARTGVSWSLRLTRCLPWPPVQSTTPVQRSGFTTTAASKPAHHLRPDSFRPPDHRPTLPSTPPPHSPHRPLPPVSCDGRPSHRSSSLIHI